MRKNINLPVFAIVGATVLFVGFARNASAIPDSINSWNSGKLQSDYDAVPSIGLSPAGASSLVVFAADLKENNGKPHDLIVSHFERDNHGTPIGSSPSVPDGGTTAMMLGATLCGFVLLTKKVKI
jgi:hypothetical protein